MVTGTVESGVRPSLARRTLHRLAAGRPAWITRVHGRSMEPTLHHSQLAVTHRLRATDTVHRGDLVVIETATGQVIVKRVIGLPGERISIIDGLVIVEGRPLHEPYARPSLFTGQFHVPQGAYLLLGDNRDASHDSRTWNDPYTQHHQLNGRLRRPGASTLARPVTEGPTWSK